MDTEVLFIRYGSIGQQVAEFTKRYFPEIVKNTSGFKAKNYKQALTDAFLGLDKKLESEEGKALLAEINKTTTSRDAPMQSETEDLANCIGCTACVALITKTEIIVANAGDSRCVLSKNGTAMNMSEDHKPDLEEEKSRIEKAGGYVEDNRVNGVLSLSRSFGDLDYKQSKKLPPECQMITSYPDVKIEKITSESDFLIIACDGVWDCMRSQEAVDYVKESLVKFGFKPEKPSKLSKILEALMDKIIAPDIASNSISSTTVIIYRRSRLR